MQNAFILWNTLALRNAIAAARCDGQQISEEDLNHVLPTTMEHISFVERFAIDLRLRPPFNLAAQG